MKVYYDSQGNPMSNKDFKDLMKNKAMKDLVLAEDIEKLEGGRFDWMAKELRQNALKVIKIWQINNITNKLMNDFTREGFDECIKYIKNII